METVNKKVVFADNNILRLQWPVQQSLSYGVRVNFEEEAAKNEVKYQVRVTRLKPAATGEALFQIERTSDVFINEQLPDLVADRLAYTAGKVFYPLVISVDGNGGFESVYNHQQILKRWEATKANIMANFDGELVEQYVARMEKQLASRAQVQMALFHNDWFLQTFFKPIYKTYGPGHTSQSTYRFPVLKSLLVDGYTTQEKLNPYFTDFGAVELVHEGAIIPATDDAIDIPVGSGSYEGYYILHPGFKHIVFIISDFEYQDEKKTNVKVKIFMIPQNGQAFDHDFILNGKDAAYPQQPGLVIVDGPDKGSFWDRLFK
jgi:hypothetical protein